MINSIFAIIAFTLGINSIKRKVASPIRLKMKMNKYQEKDTVTILKVPKEYLQNQEDANPADSDIYKKTYNLFGKVLESKVPKEDLEYYYHNFASMKEEDYPKVFKILSFLQHSPEDNSQNIMDDNAINRAIFHTTHDLLHASSTYYDEKTKIVYSGFSQVFLELKDKVRGSYGAGINECYTEMINRRFFLEEPEIHNSREEEHQVVAKALEQIVGEEKLQSLYFKADLYGLVQELKQYKTEEEVYKFINDTDNICFHSKEKDFHLENILEVKSYINSFLFLCYLESLKKKNEYDTEKVKDFTKNCIPYHDAPIQINKDTFSYPKNETNDQDENSSDTDEKLE